MLFIKFQIEILQKIGCAREEEFIRPVFPNQQDITKPTEECYNLQLLSVSMNMNFLVRFWPIFLSYFALHLFIYLLITQGISYM